MLPFYEEFGIHEIHVASLFANLTSVMWRLKFSTVFSEVEFCKQCEVPKISRKHEPEVRHAWNYPETK